MQQASPRALPSLTSFSFWLSLPQLITWGSVFYTFSLLMTPLEAELGMTRAESSLAFSLALRRCLTLRTLPVQPGIRRYTSRRIA